MVLPILIGVGLLAAVLIAGRPIGEAFNRLTKSEERKDLELQKETLEFQKSKRGFFDNASAFLFGEPEPTGPKRETVNSVKTGSQFEDTVSSNRRYNPTLNTRNFSRRMNHFRT